MFTKTFAAEMNTVAKVALELGSRGTLQPKTFAAMKLEDFIANLKS